MQILIIGRNGQVAQSLAKIGHGRNISIAGRGDLDLADEFSIKNFLNNFAKTLSLDQKNVIINSAAYTNVEQAEDEEGLAMMVNARAQKIIAEFAAKNGVLYVSYSTDYVFDGTSQVAYSEDSITNPINIYGASKLAGEREVENSGAEYLMLRTSWVFSPMGQNFVKKISQLIKSRDQISVINDQIGKPTSSEFLAEITYSLIDLLGAKNNPKEIIHVSQESEISWYGFAEKIKEIMGNQGAKIIPCLSSDFKTKAMRPKYSPLSTSKLQKIIGVENLRKWDIDLQNIIRLIE
ncbi:MAG: dTDP-4-dehydrorhamnose reductase [Rickettsiaceae bacterium]|nr:dTDP-4-dehydrorhamnose reductase [Rickettsiaceae bacterium]